MRNGEPEGPTAVPLVHLGVPRCWTGERESIPSTGAFGPVPGASDGCGRSRLGGGSLVRNGTARPVRTPPVVGRRVPPWTAPRIEPTRRVFAEEVRIEFVQVPFLRPGSWTGRRISRVDPTISETFGVGRRARRVRSDRYDDTRGGRTPGNPTGRASPRPVAVRPPKRTAVRHRFAGGFVARRNLPRRRRRSDGGSRAHCRCERLRTVPVKDLSEPHEYGLVPVISNGRRSALTVDRGEPAVGLPPPRSRRGSRSRRCRYRRVRHPAHLLLRGATTLALVSSFPCVAPRFPSGSS